MLQKGLNTEPFTAEPQFPSTSLYNANGVYSAELDLEFPIQLPITKDEPHDPVSNFIFPKEEVDVNWLDVNIPADLVEWDSSQDLMGIVLGTDLKKPEFEIRLDDDIYIEANKQLEANVFPVIIL